MKCRDHVDAPHFIKLSESLYRFFFQRNFLGFSDDKSIELYHAFVALCYFFPLLGGILSDSYWGKVKTVSIMALIYLIGMVVLTVSALPQVSFTSGLLPAYRYFRLALIKIILAWRIGAGDN